MFFKNNLFNKIGKNLKIINKILFNYFYFKIKLNNSKILYLLKNI